MAASTRTPYVGTELAGDILTKANFDRLPGGLIGYAQSSTSQTGITTPALLTAGTAMSVAVTPNTATRILRIGYAINIVSTVDNDNCRVNVLKDGATLDTRVFTVSQLAAADGTACASAVCIDIAPTLVSHTYTLQFGRSGTSTGTWSTQASSAQLTSMYVWDDGPSF